VRGVEAKSRRAWRKIAILGHLKTGKHNRGEIDSDLTKETGREPGGRKNVGPSEEIWSENNDDGKGHLKRKLNVVVMGAGPVHVETGAAGGERTLGGRGAAFERAGSLIPKLGTTLYSSWGGKSGHAVVCFMLYRKRDFSS